jgi:hypothetical protein
MADHIPFVFGADDCKLLKNLYADSAVIRLSLQTHGRILDELPTGPSLWIDAGADGLHSWRPQRITKKGRETRRYEAYDEYIKQFPGHDQVANNDFQSKPRNDVVKGFVESVLNKCCALSPKPAWVSVPQLPMVSDASRNKINRALAQNAAEWKRATKHNVKLILPVIFTHSRQVSLKTLRKGELAKECYELAGAQGVWMVDSTLNDQDGSGSLDNRFQGLIRFHQELAEALPSDAIKIAGPYWGMNLILWARGLIHYPSIGLGGAYKYYIPGLTPTAGVGRIALSPLRRLAIASPGLSGWLGQALTKIIKGEPAYMEFGELSRSLPRIIKELEELSRSLPRIQLAPLGSKTQAARFYKSWFDGLASVPVSGRALALFQDLSKAFVLGRSLPSLPAAEGTARRPERVAQQLMLNCL